MDWTLAIEKNRAALKGILAMLVYMVASANGGSAGGKISAGDSLLSFPQVDAPSQNPALAEKSKLSPTLPRHLHRFVLRLLRPAEAAARRLIIVAARGLVVELSPPRMRPAKPKPILNRSNGFGTGVLIRPGPLPEWARALAPKRSSSLSLPLFDPLKRFGGRRYVKQRDVPRIRSFDDPRVNLFQQPRAPEPLPPSPDDSLDANRLRRRLEAMASALDDLPRQAKRLARWQARRDAALGWRTNGATGQAADLPPCGGDVRQDREGCDVAQRGEVASRANSHRLHRFSPMRPGRPPGFRRRPDHPVYEVLDELHGLAVWAMARPDTS